MNTKESRVRIVTPSVKWGLLAGDINKEIHDLESLGFETISVQVYETNIGPHALVLAKEVPSVSTNRKKETEK